MNIPRVPDDVPRDCISSTALPRAVLVFISNNAVAGPCDLLHKVTNAMLLFRLPLVSHLLNFCNVFVSLLKNHRIH